MLNEKCEACRFFQSKDSAGGSCHLVPPSPHYPAVKVDDWCGKFQPKNRPMTRGAKPVMPPNIVIREGEIGRIDVR